MFCHQAVKADYLAAVLFFLPQIRGIFKTTPNMLCLVMPSFGWENRHYGLYRQRSFKILIFFEKRQNCSDGRCCLARAWQKQLQGQVFACGSRLLHGFFWRIGMFGTRRAAGIDYPHGFSPHGFSDGFECPCCAGQEEPHELWHRRRGDENRLLVLPFGAHPGTGLAPWPVGETNQSFHESAGDGGYVIKVDRRTDHQGVGMFPQREDGIHVIGDSALTRFGTRMLHALSAVGAEFDVGIGQVDFPGCGACCFRVGQDFRNQLVNRFTFTVAADNSEDRLMHRCTSGHGHDDRFPV